MEPGAFAYDFRKEKKRIFTIISKPFLMEQNKEFVKLFGYKKRWFVEYKEINYTGHANCSILKQSKSPVDQLQQARAVLAEHSEAVEDARQVEDRFYSEEIMKCQHCGYDGMLFFCHRRAREKKVLRVGHLIMERVVTDQ